MVPAFIIAEQNGYILPTSATIGELMKTGFKESRHLWITVIDSFGSYGPMIAAVIMAGLEGELRVWWKRVTNWRVGKSGYRDLILLILVIFVPLILISLVLGPFPTRAFGSGLEKKIHLLEQGGGCCAQTNAGRC